MTNEEAINTLKSLKDYYNDKNEDSYVGFDDEDNEALDIAINALEQQQDVHDTCKKCIEFSEFEQQPRWITVSESLPKEWQKVIVTTRSDNSIEVDTAIFYHASAFWKHYVIAWMPLSEPYKAESEEDAE